MKLIITLCFVAKLHASEQHVWNTLSNHQALLLEQKFINTDFKKVEIEDARAIVRYLIDEKKESFPSLLKKLDESVNCGKCEGPLKKFYLGISGWGRFCHILKNYYIKTHNTSLICPPSPPVVIVTHWYDVFFSRSDSGSSSHSKESDHSIGYFKKKLDKYEETDPLIEKKDK